MSRNMFSCFFFILLPVKITIYVHSEKSPSLRLLLKSSLCYILSYSDVTNAVLLHPKVKDQASQFVN